MPELADLPSTLHARTNQYTKEASAPTGSKLNYVSPNVAQSEPIASIKSSDTEFNWNLPDETAIWKRRTNIREYPIERDVLLFHPELQLVCRLNETACFLWRNSDGRSILQMTGLLRETYHTEAATARRHILRIFELFAINQFVYQESRNAVAC